MVSAMETTVKTIRHTSPVQYLKNIYLLARSMLEGMAVTSSYLFRRPITIQYPYKLKSPMETMLPDQFRGILEVDIRYCMACLRCQQACPIECIAITTEKNVDTKERLIVRFDIDISKCMFCGLCVEQCPTRAIHHTKVFDGSSHYVENLILQFVDTPSRPFKKPKTSETLGVDQSGAITKAKLKDFFEPPDFYLNEKQP